MAVYAQATGFRDRLPPKWRYGWRFGLVQVGLAGPYVAFLAGLVYVCFVKPLDTEEGAPVNPASYQYVYNERGHPVDIAHKRLSEAAARARENSRRYSQ